MSRLPFQVPFEPIARQFSNLLQRSRFFKQMSGTRHNRDLFLTAQFGEGLPIQLYYLIVIASDNQ